MKKVLVSVAGTGGKQEYKDVQLMPGTKPRDVLSTLGLTGMELTRPDGGTFAMNDNLYDAVENGQKIFAAKATAEAGC